DVSMDFKQKTVVVTGGVSGLGEATVRMALSKEANVVALDVNEEKGKKLQAGLGENFLFLSADVTSEESVQSALDEVKSHFGSIHILANCAGIAEAKKTLGKKGPHDLNAFSKVIQINLIGTFNMIRLAAEKMAVNTPNEDGEKGVIINTASVAAYDGQIGQVAYSASKGGIVGMTLPIA